MGPVEERAVPSTGRRIAGIEGLRALAALSVLLGHTHPASSPSGLPGYGFWTHHLLPLTAVGLTLFFTLSGFLLYRPFAAAALRGEVLDVRAYLHNRALRIVPAYWAAVLVCGIVAGLLVLRTPGGEIVIGRSQSPLELLEHLTLVYQLHPSTAFTGVAPAWSLAVEVAFYLSLPLLGLIAARAATSRWGAARPRAALLVPAGLLVALGASGLLALEALAPGGDGEFGASWHAVVGRSFWSMAALFAAGMAVAVVRVEQERGRLRLPRRWFAATVLLMAGSTLLADRLLTGDVVGYHGYQLLMSVACACLLALVVLDPRRNVLVALLERRAVVYLGLISYGVFLWHMPVLSFLGMHGLLVYGDLSLAINTLITAAISIAIASLSWFTVERFALRRKRRPGTVPEPRSGAAVMGTAAP